MEGGYRKSMHSSFPLWIINSIEWRQSEWKPCFRIVYCGTLWNGFTRKSSHKYPHFNVDSCTLNGCYLTRLDIARQSPSLSEMFDRWSKNLESTPYLQADPFMRPALRLNFALMPLLYRKCFWTSTTISPGNNFRAISRIS